MISRSLEEDSRHNLWITDRTMSSFCGILNFEVDKNWRNSSKLMKIQNSGKLQKLQQL
jgi:hypothetical protein